MRHPIILRKTNRIHSALPRHYRGFTLLQMMLAVIILAIAVGFGANLFKQQLNQNTNDKTAMDMLQLLQAAQTYYQDNGYWPNDIYALVNSAKYAGLGRCGVLFLGSGTNDTYSCGRYNGYTLTFPAGYSSGAPGTSATKATQVIISTVAPNKTIAEAIAAKLPQASVNNANISASIYAPGMVQSSDFANLLAADKILLVQNVYTDLLGKKQAEGNSPSLPDKMNNERYLTLYLPSCPAGWVPNYDAAFAQLSMNKNSAASTLGDYDICKTQYAFNSDDGGKLVSLTVKTTRRPNSNFFSAGVMLVTYCRPPTSLVPSPSWINASMLKKLAGKGPENGNGDAGACEYGPFTNSSGDLK